MINYEGQSILFSEFNNSFYININTVCYSFLIYSKYRERVILSFGQLKEVSVQWNSKLLFQGLSSRHEMCDKFIVEIENGDNQLKIIAQANVEIKDVLIKIEPYDISIKSFFSKEYNIISSGIAVNISDLKEKKGKIIKIYKRNVTILYDNIIELFIYNLNDKILYTYKTTFYEKKEIFFDKCNEDIVKLSIEYNCNKRKLIYEEYLLVDDFKNILQKVDNNSILEVFKEKEQIGKYNIDLFVEYYKKHKKIKSNIFIEEYKSNLDENINSYVIKKPKYYSEEKKYPLIIQIATDYSRYEKGLFINRAQKIKEDVVLAMINIKGITMGTYIGEAFFYETLNIIINKYSIDNDKIFLTGYSNGAYAVWAIAERNPTLYKGICILSGAANIDYIDNIDNMPVLCIGSEEDYEYFSGFYLPMVCMNEKILNKTFILLKKEIHSSFYFYYLCDSIIKWLLYLSNRNESVTINFKNKGYSNKKTRYFEIIEIKNEYINYNIVIKPRNKEELIINLYNISKINIFINRILEIWKDAKKIIIVYEENIINYMINNKSNIYITLKEKIEVKVLENEIYPKGRKLQLLDIYYKPLVIGISDNIKELHEVANNFSTPYSAGWRSKINVKYPIIIVSDENEIINNSKNVIYVTLNSKDKLLTMFIKQLDCVIKKDYIRYKDFMLKGEYLIGIIAEKSKENEILLLYTNNIKLYMKSLFTRRLILPSNINSEEHIFKKQVFIYDGKKYYGID